MMNELRESSGLIRRIVHPRLLRLLGRAELLRTVVRHQRLLPDDITVVIGARNRSDFRLTNALRSIRAQTGIAHPIRVLVVDYSSDPTHSRMIQETCLRHHADFIRVDNELVWSRSRCLNIGIRHARTKFLIVSDVDVILSPGYLADAIDALRASPLSVIVSPMLDLPKATAKTLKRAAETDEPLPVEIWKTWCSRRLEWEFHPSIAVTYTSFFQLIRGYDEYYEQWGAEDLDLMGRFESLGLQPRSVSPKSCYLHQWHARFEGVPEGKNAKQIQLNHSYFEKHHSIIRNNANWGLPTAP